jgi:hypothetical protein
MVSALLLTVLGGAGSIDPEEAIALWFLLIFGLILISLDYGLATVHLRQFEGERWVHFHRGLARLPPLLLLLGFPAVVLLELPEDVPFMTVLFIFCWTLLITSLVTTLVTTTRMFMALRSVPEGPHRGPGPRMVGGGPISGNARTSGPI